MHAGPLAPRHATALMLIPAGAGLIDGLPKPISTEVREFFFIIFCDQMVTKTGGIEGTMVRAVSNKGAIDAGRDGSQLGKLDNYMGKLISCKRGYRRHLTETRLLGDHIGDDPVLFDEVCVYDGDSQSERPAQRTPGRGANFLCQIRLACCVPKVRISSIRLE